MIISTKHIIDLMDTGDIGHMSNYYLIGLNLQHYIIIKFAFWPDASEIRLDPRSDVPYTFHVACWVESLQQIPLY